MDRPIRRQGSICRDNLSVRITCLLLARVLHEALALLPWRELAGAPCLTLQQAADNDWLRRWQTLSPAGAECGEAEQIFHERSQSGLEAGSGWWLAEGSDMLPSSSCHADAAIMQSRRWRPGVEFLSDIDKNTRRPTVAAPVNVLRRLAPVYLQTTIRISTLTLSKHWIDAAGSCTYGLQTGV